MLQTSAYPFRQVVLGSDRLAVRHADRARLPAMSIRREDARTFQQGKHSLIPVLLRESVIDSVTFRATTKYFEDQVEAVDSWLIAFVKQSREFTAQFCRLEEQALSLNGKAVPTFVESGIIDPDYTVTAMSRCNEANRAYWSSIFDHAREAEQTLTEPLLRLQNNELKEIRHLRNEFQKTQKSYDETVRYYFQQPKTKEASSLREDAFQLYERRKAYIKASFDYTIKMSTFRSALDAALIAAFSRSFESAANHTSALATDFASRPSMGRIMSWSDEMVESSRNAEEYLYTVRFELEDDINRLVTPTRDLGGYTSTPQKRNLKDVSARNATRPAKQGWLMMRAVTGKPARYVWLRRWCYVKDGIFGWLSNNPKTGAVEESDKIGVLLCNVKSPLAEDRRFCFEVLTKDSTILLQAESDHDVLEWLTIFEQAKQAILAMKESNEYAFAVTKPRPEFAAAYQALEGGHGEAQLFDSQLASSAIKDVNKKGHAKQDSSSHGIGALISASNIASNLAAPRVGHLFGGKIEDQKYFNPFESPVEGNSLAPTTFAPAPFSTHLTRESLLDSSTSVVHGPSGTQANYWGSLNYGLLNYTNKEHFEGKGAEKLLSAPEAAIDDAYAVRDREMSEKGILNVKKEFPSDYPAELRRQDMQFCTLFPHARAEHVLMVIRSSRPLEGHKSVFSGRIYVTLRGLYFYSQSYGMVLVQSCLFSEILSVRVTRKLHFDELTIDVHDFGEATATIYLDDASLVRKRIELLLANYIADEPKNALQMLSILKTTLPDDTQVVARPATGNKRTNQGLDSSEDEDDDSPPNRRSGKVDVMRLKLPSEPVLTEPDDQMLAKVYDAEYMITAKGLFHLLFGNRSPVWLQCYAMFNVPNVQQGPWKTVEDGALARVFSYRTMYCDANGKSETVQKMDYQKISKRVEHLDYTVLTYRQLEQYPFGSKSSSIVKFNISFVSKTKSRLRMWLDVDWKGQNYLLRGMVQQAVLAEFLPNVGQVTHFIEREVLDRLGLQSKTSKAVRIYGRVGGHSEPFYLDKNQDPLLVARRRRLSLLNLIKIYPAEFMTSLYTESFLLMLAALSQVWDIISANGIIFMLLVLSLLANTWLSGKSSVIYWQHRSAVQLLDNINTSPVGLMARAVTLSEINEIAYNASSAMPANPGKCFDTFTTKQGSIGTEFQSAFMTSRASLARSRNDLLVAMKVLNGIEAEIVKGEWSKFVELENRNCKALDGMDVTALGLVADDLKDHCHDCARYSDVWRMA